MGPYAYRPDRAARRARQAVEPGDDAEAHAPVAIALADAGDELAAWVGNLDLKRESIDHWLSEVTKALCDLGGWADQRRPRRAVFGPEARLRGPAVLGYIAGRRAKRGSR